MVTDPPRGNSTHLQNNPVSELPIFITITLELLMRLQIAELQIEPNQNHLLNNLEGSIFAWLFVVVRHADDSSDVTLVFEDADW